MQCPSIVRFSSRCSPREPKRSNLRADRLIVLEDHGHVDSEVPMERFSRPNAVDVGQASSPAGVDRHSSLIKETTSYTLVRGRSASPDRHTSKDLGVLKDQLKSMVMSRSMPNLEQGRSSYNRCIGRSILSSVTESNQDKGRLIASEQAAELDLLLQDF